MFEDFFLIFGMALLGLILVFLLKSNRSYSRRLLIVLIISTISFLLYYYAYLHKMRVLGGVAVLLGSCSGYLLGPLLLFYLKSLVLPYKAYKNAIWWHLIPFFVAWTFLSLPSSISMMTGYLSDYHVAYVSIADYLNLVENAFALSYMFFTLSILKRYERLTLHYYSTENNLNLEWFRNLLIGFIVIVCTDSLISVYELFYPVLDWNLGNIIAFCLILLFAYLGYKGIFQSKVLLPELAETSARTTGIKPKTKPVPVSNAEMAEFEKKLEQLLAVDKLYLDESLNLTDLSEKLGISSKQLSSLLNNYLGTTFYDLINSYRVEEVKKRIKDPSNDQYTLLAIALDSGFQAKSSFNRIFKQKTGTSPSKYRELQRKSD